MACSYLLAVSGQRFHTTQASHPRMVDDQRASNRIRHGDATMKLNGTTYSDETPLRVAEILEHSRTTKERIIILYGDTVTGRLWKKEVDERGYVGRHNGVPVL